MYPIAQIYEDMEREAKRIYTGWCPSGSGEKLRVENIIIRGTPYLEIIRDRKKIRRRSDNHCHPWQNGHLPRASGKHSGKGCEKGAVPGLMCETS